MATNPENGGKAAAGTLMFGAVTVAALNVLKLPGDKLALRAAHQLESSAV